VVALALTSGSSRATWRTFVSQLEEIGYSHGENTGFASALIYPSVWIADNIYRGNVKEITEDLSGSKHCVKTLDYITSHRDLYPALSDSITYEKMKRVEEGYRSHRVPYMAKESIAAKIVKDNIRNGDIIVILTKDIGLDSKEIGIVKLVNGNPYMIYASSVSGKVEMTSVPVAECFKHEWRQAQGYRIIRVTE
jgi:hypothetical protein